MLIDIIEDFARRMESRVAELTAEFTRILDFAGLEAALNEECAKLNAELQQAMLQALLLEEMFLSLLKIHAGRLGMRFKEYRRITVTLSNGQRVEISSPYFIKAKPHSRRRKRGPNGTGAHSGLEILGFVGRVSPGLLSDALQMSLLCPSYEVACTVLKGRGIELDVKTLRRLCSLAGTHEINLRARLSLNGEENLRGYTLVVSVDGGRLRERKRKRGRKAKKLKRQGYHSDWREPELFTIYLMDSEGNIVKEFKPLHDGTMAGRDGVFDLIEAYLRNLEIEQLERIVFCGDGAKWIWNGTEKLCERMGFDKNQVYQVLDWTHAKQNLHELLKLVSPKKRAVTIEKWEYLLWQGKIDALGRSIEETITGKADRERAMKKFTDYFAGNRERMQYADFKKKGLPRGSGHVESAIRRVINLRLKAPGTFWLKDMAECFLFLRSQLLSGRWEIFMGNLTALKRRAFWPVYAANEEAYDLPKAA
jgi:putative ubiquitin-RnfH superfamily antitoxin RatB of RatAB toxin-antitoxin module